MTTLDPGARVCDKERPDEAPIAVVIRHTRTAIKWYRPGGVGGKTIAEFNPGYDPYEDMVEVMFPSKLDEVFGDRWRKWDSETFDAELETVWEELQEADDTYGYPLSRLMYCGEPGVELDEARGHALRNIENLQLARSA